MANHQSSAVALEPLWKQQLQNPIVGISLARETDVVLAWDASNWLYQFNHAGQRQAQVRFPTSIQAAAADDGSAIAVASTDGLFWLAPDLSTRRREALSHAANCLAIDSFGKYAAIADGRNHVAVFDRLGGRVTKLTLPRSFHHLAFAAASALIVGAADYGLVGCFDLQGALRWRHGLVAHVGGISVAGTSVLLACFSEGLQSYDLTGNNLGRLKGPESPCLLSTSFDGQVIVITGRDRSVTAMDAAGKAHGVHQVEQPVTALAMSALGDYVIIGDDGGALAKLAIHPQ